MTNPETTRTDSSEQIHANALDNSVKPPVGSAQDDSVKPPVGIVDSGEASVADSDLSVKPPV
jgi:hypothetical protein